MADVATRQGSSLALWHRTRRAGTYRPQPGKRVAIPHPDGGVRKLGMPTGRERGCQQALGQRMEPMFEPQLRDWAWGDRPGRSPPRAMRKVWQALQAGNVWSVAAALRPYFAPMDQDKLLDWIAEESSDGRGRPLGRHSWRAGACADGDGQPTVPGGPKAG